MLLLVEKGDGAWGTIGPVVGGGAAESLWSSDIFDERRELYSGAAILRDAFRLEEPMRELIEVPQLS